MQPESQQPPRFTISADGKCPSLSELDRTGGESETPGVIEIMINGNIMMGGSDSPTLIGTPGEFLSLSIHYTLESFEPQADGRCLARYVRNTKSERDHSER